MQEISLAIPALAGLLTGFLGAIPPGPLNVTIIRKASHGKRHEAFRVAIGGAVVDTLICGAIGLGFAWILEKVVTQRWVKLGLAFFLLAYGLKILLVDTKADREAAAERAIAGPDTPAPPSTGGPLHILVGFLQGAANPALLVNWTLVISFLVGQGLLRSNAASAIPFAIGVGLGVFLWFALLIELLGHLHDHPIGLWIRRSTFFAGLFLVAFGLYFTFRSLEDHLAR